MFSLCEIILIVYILKVNGVFCFRTISSDKQGVSKQHAFILKCSLLIGRIFNPQEITANIDGIQ